MQPAITKINVNQSEEIALIKRIAESLTDSSVVKAPMSHHLLIVGSFPRDLLWNVETTEIEVRTYGVSAKALRGILAELIPEHAEITPNPLGNFTIRLEHNESVPMKFVCICNGTTEKKAGGFEHQNSSSYPTPCENLLYSGFNVNSLALDPLTDTIIDFTSSLESTVKGEVRILNERYFADTPARIVETLRLFTSAHPDVISAEQSKLTELAEYLILDGSCSEEIWYFFSTFLLESKRPSVGLEFLRNLGLRYRFFPSLARHEPADREFQWRVALRRVNRAAKIIRTRSEATEKEQLSLLLTALIVPLLPISAPMPSMIVRQRDRLASNTLEELSTRIGLPGDSADDLKRTIVAMHLITDLLSKKGLIQDFSASSIRVRVNQTNPVNPMIGGSLYKSIEKSFKKVNPENPYLMELLFDVWDITPFYEKTFFDLGVAA